MSDQSNQDPTQPMTPGVANPDDVWAVDPQPGVSQQPSQGDRQGRPPAPTGAGWGFEGVSPAPGLPANAPAPGSPLPEEVVSKGSKRGLFLVLGLLLIVAVGGFMAFVVSQEGSDTDGAADSNAGAGATSTQPTTGAEPGPAPTARVTRPQTGSTFGAGEQILVTVELSRTNVVTLELLLDGVSVSITEGNSVSFAAEEQHREIKVNITTDEGTVVRSAPVFITVVGDEPLDPEEIAHAEAIALFQEFEDEAAAGNWARLAQLDPAKAAYSTDRWVEGYGLVDQVWVIPVRTLDVSGDVRTERIGLVTNEIDAVTGQQISKLFCLTWEANLAAGTLKQTNKDTTIYDPFNGYISHLDYQAQLKEEC